MRYIENQKFEHKQYEKESYEDIQFIDCQFQNCHFLEITVENCRFQSCEFSHCVIGGITFKYSDMSTSQFSNSVLVGIDWNDLKIRGGDASPFSSLNTCILKYNYFTRLRLKNYDFRNSEFVESCFEECNLVSSNFGGVPLHASKFLKCDLTKADFREAMDYRIDIKDNKLKGARFSFPEVVNLLHSLGVVIE